MTCPLCGQTHGSRGSAYPFGAELVPDDWRQPFRIDPKFDHMDIDDEAEGFMLRNLSAKGSTGVYKCWRAAWRNWMRIARQRTPKPVIGLEKSQAKGGWQAYAKANGIDSKPGESWPAYQQRVEAIMKRTPGKPILELIG